MEWSQRSVSVCTTECSLTTIHSLESTSRQSKQKRVSALQMTAWNTAENLCLLIVIALLASGNRNH
jgi:hypothetical protein